MGPQSCKGSDHLAERNVFHRLRRLCRYGVQSLSRRIGAFFVLNVRRRRSHQKVSVDRRSDENAFSVFSRKGEHCTVYVPACRLVQQLVFALPRCDMYLLFTYHIVKDIRVNAGRIDDSPSLHRSPGGRQAEPLFQLFHPLHFRAEPEFDAVAARVLRQRDCQLEGTHDSARRRIQPCDHLIGQVRLHFHQFFSLQNLKTLHTVLLSALQQFFQAASLFFGRTDNQRTVLLKRNIQFFRQFFHFPAAFQIHFCFHGAWLRVKTCVDDPAVCLGGAAADVLLPLQHTELPLIPGKFSGDRAAAHPGPDYDHIIHKKSPIISIPHSSVLLQQQRTFGCFTLYHRIRHPFR